MSRALLPFTLLLLGVSSSFAGLSGQELLHLDERLLSLDRLSLKGGVDRARPDTPELWSRSLVEPIKPSVGPENAGLRSLLVPGLGQLALGNRRGWAYAGLELLGWLWYFDRRVKGTDLRREYRDYAWQKARLQSGPRVDGDFDYYEVMSQWERSGHFDLDLGREGTQPELNPSYYNGLIWTRALGIFSVGQSSGPGDPEYESAIRYYEQYAYGTGFLWNWTETPGGRLTYADIIRKSDDRFRQARNAVGFVIANHLVSAADAFVSGRTGLDIEARVGPGMGGSGVTLAARLGTSWH
jgi:hypothetical protein